ncbi:tRNA uridine(34) 5-carboxymethylaminomethyl modification radical SAM/GNAT enzyme Elp3 [uncultured Olegusella sp.]|uniref:tRNA uridine(34) 5-carboxymethylaminomethyl modification radical SAM/GNAT enzyme Elp3 n=1 Tax=uncultured Olegusella sp. TaxID=1979846 RepID=UPI00260ACB24|nr:tRNA uridine(34) 5-carboxymethylaminomethyl modification radical SAM/GNAT enzyme Elp3 [uncultured Olegusella sp.]
MEELLLDILEHLRALPAERMDDALTRSELDALWRKHNRGVRNNEKHLSKRFILPFYQKIKQENPEHWKCWNIDNMLEKRLIRTIQMKPHRTGSGVATITVITRPQTCSSNCLYCPCDLRMPKSYLTNEPACQRAEHNFFDPYLQVAARLRALSQMGHSIDKIELIVLGGTWSDYPRAYQIWFIRELFRALNDWPITKETLRQRYAHYRKLGLENSPAQLSKFVETQQVLVNQGKKSFNDAFHDLYQKSEAHQSASKYMSAQMNELFDEQLRNEHAQHRVVGLVIETRPDTITPQNLTLFRQMGCTKIQMGIQSTRQAILDANQRYTSLGQIYRAFNLIRLCGFKIHAHLMVNLLGSTPESDKQDFQTFVNNSNFLPDEIKLYPCALVEGTQLVEHFRDGSWGPYSREELVDVLVSDVLATPPYIRISRMIRDISADDILVGNKHTNLRQMVENEIRNAGRAGLVQEIRFREISLDKINFTELVLDDFTYETVATNEHFLQWVTPEGRIAGFCRLSLPKWKLLCDGNADVRADELPVAPGQAMIREVHVYGQAVRLGQADVATQHKGLGRQLVERACDIAHSAGYSSINVISSVGTRAYYRRLGFEDAGLYQRRKL